MNFHISPLSPLRPRYSTSLSPSAAHPPGPSEHHHRPREPDDDDDDDDDDDGDQDNGTDHHRFLLPPHAPPPRTPVAGRAALGHPRIEVASNSSGSSGSSGSSDSDSDSDSVSADDDVTQDSRDVLVQRLNDLAQRLSAADDVRAGDVGALHAQVDEMERVLSTNTGRHSSSAAGRRVSSSSLQPGPRNGRSSMVLPAGGGGGGGGGGRNSGEVRARDALGLMGPPLSPSWLLSQLRRQPSISIHRWEEEQEEEVVEQEGDAHDERGKANGARHVTSPPTHPHPSSSTEQPEPVVAAATAAGCSSSSSSRISYEMADTIVQEAEGLCAEMASVIESLQKRREESDHLQAILVEREGAADKLLLEQAGRIGELEGAAAEDESELRYLKIQLRGIEAQCLGYIPRGADPELDRSIRSWKKDWSELRDRWAARKGSSFASGDDSSTFSSSTR